MNEEKTPEIPAPVPDFDSFAEEYELLHSQNIKASGYSTAYFAEYKIKEVARHLAHIGLAGKEINFLNYGCGIGNSEEYIRQHLPQATLYSVDVSPRSIEYARERHPDLEKMHFGILNGAGIPFDISFDAIFVANVFHHIPREQHLPVLRTLKQALKPSGHLFLFEHNPLNPLTVKAVRDCAFDKGVVLLSPSYTRSILRQAGFDKQALNFTLFFPKPLSALVPMEKYLKRIPLGAQYYVVASPD